MRKLLLTSLAAGVCWASTLAAQQAEKDTAALLKLEQDWANAVARHDVDFIERVETDSYVYTDAAGNVGHKSDDLATARSGDVKIDAFKLSAMTVALYRDTAVVTGLTTLTGSDHTGPLAGTYRWTDTFVRRADGQWQVISSQATAVAKPDDTPVLVVPAETPATSPAPDSDD